MKKILYLLMLLVVCIGCKNATINGTVIDYDDYDFEALRDSLGLDSTCVFVKECSPLYRDDNPYNFNEETRTKALFYKVFPEPRFDYWEEPDTVVWEVLRNNKIVFAGRNQMNATAKGLIDWVVNNREKN